MQEPCVIQDACKESDPTTEQKNLRPEKETPTNKTARLPRSPSKALSYHAVLFTPTQFPFALKNKSIVRIRKSLCKKRRKTSKSLEELILLLREGHMPRIYEKSTSAELFGGQNSVFRVF